MDFNTGKNDNLSGLNDRSNRQYVDNTGLGDHRAGQQGDHRAGQQGVGLDNNCGDRTGLAGGGLGSGGLGSLTGTKGQHHDHSQGHSHGREGGVLSEGNETGLQGAHGSQNMSGKPTMGEKVKGAFEELKGKVTGNPEAQIQGQARKQGELSSGQKLGGGAGVGY